MPHCHPRRPALAGAVLPLFLFAGCAATDGGAPPPPAPAYGGGDAQLFEGMGKHSRKVTTASADAQRYFDQGLNWLYGFNHDEAVRAFTKAAELDPGCAMAWWGVAYAQGPNYNDPHMSPARSQAAYQALEQARGALDDETPVERALVEALRHRYTDPAPEDRRELDEAFADAMATVWTRHPDPDVGTLYAEAMMTLDPWQLYENDGSAARARTGTIVAVLEKVLAEDAANPGANHLYIHAVEPSDDKDRGIAAADRLSNLVPGCGHLLHMPSHIYVQVGMWDRSIEQNARAMEKDRDYRHLAASVGFQNGYTTHNSHMLAFSAMMIGKEQRAMEAARAMWDDLPDEARRQFAPFFDAWMCSAYDVQKRFGRWDALLAEPAPPEYLPVTTAVWHAHRAIAYAAKKDFDNARREHAVLHAAKDATGGMPPDIQQMTNEFLAVSDKFVEAEIALQQERWGEAITLLEDAAKLEDDLGYGEPPMWLQPVRHTLGAVYLKAGRPKDAERAYREDLHKWPGNGWSLFGLTRALEEQGRTDEAADVRRQFDKVWAGADAPIQTSCMCIPKT